MNVCKVDLDSIVRQQWTVIINGFKYKTTKQTAFFLSPSFRSYSEKHPSENLCKIDIDGAEGNETLISTILKLRGTLTITISNYDFLRRFCDKLHITLFDSQLNEFEEKVVSISKSVANEPHIRILKSIERELLKISPDRIEKVFEALNRAYEVAKQDSTDAPDTSRKKSSPRSQRSKKETTNVSSQKSATDEIQLIPIVKSPLTICSAIFGLCISQPQNIDMYVNLLSICNKEIIEKFKQILFKSNFETQEESFLARMMEHIGLVTREELKAFNRCGSIDETGKIKINELKRTKNFLKNGLNGSLIDINSNLNEANKQLTDMKNYSIGESFPTFFADLATSKQLKFVSSKFDYFELNLPKLSKNDWELHKNLSFCGRNEHPIAIAIRKDDVDSLQKLVSDPSFKRNSTIKPSIYERFSIMNITKKSNEETKEDNEEGIRLIDFSAFFGALKCFKYLLLNGFEFSKNSFNYAICGGVSEIIHICEDKKCPSKGSLIYSIQFHRHDIFNWLIDTKGEDPNENPFKIAKYVVQYFNMGCLISLIQRGFNPSYFIIPAIECNNLLLIEYLATIQHLNFDDQLKINKKEIFPIIDAFIVGFNLDVVKFLLKYCKCDMNKEGKWKLTPLHLACLNNDEETVNFLIQTKKANLNAMAEILMRFVCSYKEGSWCLSPLHFACQIGAENIVSFLNQNEKTDVNSLANISNGDEGVTPLHIACKEGNLNVVKILFNNQKVNKLAKTKIFCFSPFHFACQSGNLNLVQFIKSELKDSFNVNEGVDKHSLTPLHVASFSGLIEIVTFLLKQPKINVNSKSTFVKEIEYIDITPLHLACLNGKGKIVEILLNESSIAINSVAVFYFNFFMKKPFFLIGLKFIMFFLLCFVNYVLNLFFIYKISNLFLINWRVFLFV